MNKAQPDNLNVLESMLDIHLYTINIKSFDLEINKLLLHTDKTADTHQFGIVIPIHEAQNAIKKIASLLFTSLKIRKLKNKLNTTTPLPWISYGVYPHISQPVAIYQLQSPAEIYANKHILPPMQKGLNGFLRRIVFSIIKFHPSTAGIILILDRNS